MERESAAVRLNRIPGVVAGFTTRSGGVSQPPYDSFNLAVSSGDEQESVDENRRRLLERTGFGPGRLVIAGQVHGARVAVVNAPGLVPETDGLVTRERGLLLGIVAADCAAVLVADRSGMIVGAAHAGWRGTSARIVNKLVSTMRRSGLAGDALLAYVSPCISQEHFEVGPEVAQEFDDVFVVTNPTTGKAHVDLVGVLTSQLIEAGLSGDDIQVDGRCTVADPETFFSYRGQDGRTGRMMGFVGLSN